MKALIIFALAAAALWIRVLEIAWTLYIASNPQ